MLTDEQARQNDREGRAEASDDQHHIFRFPEHGPPLSSRDLIQGAEPVGRVQRAPPHSDPVPKFAA